MKKIAEKFYIKAKSAFSIPIDALYEINPLRHKERLMERKYIADHEAGHSLVALLDEQKIINLHINTLRLNTHQHLRDLFSIGKFKILNHTIFIKPGCLGLNDESEKIYENNSKKNLIISLAGIVNNLVNDNENSYFNAYEKIEKTLQAIEQNSFGNTNAYDQDFVMPYNYIKKRFIELEGNEPSQEQIKNIFFQVIEELKQIFEEETFRKSLQAISDLLIKKRKLINNVNDDLLKEIKDNNGISDQEISSMQNELDSFDIDKFITNA